MKLKITKQDDDNGLEISNDDQLPQDDFALNTFGVIKGAKGKI